ncbi:hypothetical protein METBIDRAFT_86099 [Metschnikowia bicuspidata var. bicuspidata NRRL YB-4993]|uniref:Cyclin-like domain-containing protein n=1 Tax=Metschnikowia bicuspidata var. bicuspidata NRRL YB-4993 TaxID=869754 RepID=A0A1A0HJH9_9ASCO|nr:hypothetical protein METBIDRAFT_86099 [Metschnikowia bicuspidata var. bicuspidata NRRL YB-4993]OBA23993.1 hypothetical protein METBIDRAFT_86099 [Metschnikowia bicuspidata var. bicuspidata NRRL YB-4993]
MNCSPDILHHVRVSQASLKASNINLKLAEYNAHKIQVDEYKLEIYAHLLHLDTKTKPNLQLIQQQPEINLRMRPILLDFLMDVINKLSLSKSTFPLTVNIIDRYCSVRIVKKQHYQLLGLTALWIACKNLDSKFRIPLLNDLCKYCCHCYDKKLFLEMENHVLKSFGWLVDAPTFDSFIDVYIHSLAKSRFLAGSKSPHKTCNDIKVIAIYICELIQFYPNIYFNYTLPKIAMISVVLACLILDVCKFNHINDIVEFISTLDPVITMAEFDQAFSLLTKVLKSPPPSLKAQYFNESLRFLHLMKLVVSFTWKHLAQRDATATRHVLKYSPRSEVTCTPVASGGLTTPKYPVTPVLQSISPKNPEYERPLLIAEAAALPKTVNLSKSNLDKVGFLL